MISTRTKGVRAAFVFAAAALIAGSAAPAFASDPVANKPRADGTKPEKAKRYCVEQVTTGTMLKAPKVCKTRDQWIAETGVDPVNASRK